MAITDTRLLRMIDLAGTFVLAIEGASIAAGKGLDWFGVLMISLATAMGGGMIRDMLVGEHPPEALRGWSILTVGLVGGLCTLFAFHSVEQIPKAILITVDALGLSLLAVSGVEKAIEYKLTPIAAVMMGAIAGTGGSTIRDVLLAQVPAVLQTDILATAAIAGAIVMVMLRRLNVGANWAVLFGGATCFALRVVAVWQHWSLPTAHLH